jgi:hypothetical protein
MPISTIIDSPAALYALMITTDAADLSQNYVQTANIDMTTYGEPSQSIAGSDTPTPNDFTGIYNGQGYTITIGDVSDYTGLFDTVATRPDEISGIINNVHVIYSNSIEVTLDNTITNIYWGGLVGGIVISTITNCSVTINNNVSITAPYSATPVSMFCGFMGQNSSITNSRLIINGNITCIGTTNSTIGLLCGLNTDSDIIDCSVTSSSSAFDISLAADEGSYIGLLCGVCAANILSLPIKRASIVNNTVTLNNNGSITLDTVNPSSTVYTGAICGNLYGVPEIDYQTIATNCFVNINNNQPLFGEFNDFFGQITDNPTITNCQFLYRTTTDNTSRVMEISPTPPAETAVTYVNNYSDTYNLVSGNYYIPNETGSLQMDAQTITMESQISPDGILINGVLYVVGTTYSASNNTYVYTISVNGVGSMYFGLVTIIVLQSSVQNTIECVCQINSCSTNPQTGITADSRITNMVEDKTIRANVEREFATNSVIYPKFKSYSDYIKYLQAGLKY